VPLGFEGAASLVRAEALAGLLVESHFIDGNLAVCNHVILLAHVALVHAFWTARRSAEVGFCR